MTSLRRARSVREREPNSRLTVGLVENCCGQGISFWRRFSRTWVPAVLQGARSLEDLVPHLTSRFLPADPLGNEGLVMTLGRRLLSAKLGQQAGHDQRRGHCTYQAIAR